MSDQGPLEQLAAQAHDTHVVVIGGGVAGLVAALECAKVGLRVTLVEASPTLGGTIRSVEIDGHTLDAGADGWSTAGGGVNRLVDDLGLTDSLAPETRLGTWIAGIPGGPAPLPAATVLGIPANAWDPAVRRLIGWKGTWRAYLDRLRPPLTIGVERNLDKLVRGRMGDRVVDRLVAPLTMGRHGLLPAEVDVEVAAPGLSTALTRTGSLAGAVSQVRGDRRSSGGYETLAGGMRVLVDALAARLDDLDARVLLDATATAVDRTPGGWMVRVAAGDDEEALETDHVVVATEEDAARALLAPHVPGVDGLVAPARAIDVVTLVVRQPALDSAPRGGSVYPVPGSSPASAIVHASARWPSIADAVGPGLHVLRVHFSGGAPSDPVAVATDAASALLGVDLDVRGASVDRFPAAPPPSAAGHIAQATAARAAVDAVPGLAVVGAWIAGSGLSHVIPDAVDAAERIRRRALFGSSAVE